MPIQSPSADLYPVESMSTDNKLAELESHLQDCKSMTHSRFEALMSNTDKVNRDAWREYLQSAGLLETDRRYSFVSTKSDDWLEAVRDVDTREPRSQSDASPTCFVGQISEKGNQEQVQDRRNDGLDSREQGSTGHRQEPAQEEETGEQGPRHGSLNRYSLSLEHGGFVTSENRRAVSSRSRRSTI